MKRFISSLLSLAIAVQPLLTAAPAIAQPLPVQAQDFLAENLLANPGFENGSYGWTASGGATKTANTTAAGQGNYGYDWDSNASSQTLVSTAATVPAGLKGKQGVAYCNIKAVSGSPTHTMEVNDGSATVGQAVTITTSTSQFTKNMVFFQFPSSGSVKIKFTSVSSNEPEIYVDSCFIGDAFNVTTPGVNTDWQSYTGTVSNGGTATFSYSNRVWRRVGDSVEVVYSFSVTADGSGSSTVYVPLPSGLAIDTAKLTSSDAIGIAVRLSGASNDMRAYVRYDGSNTSGVSLLIFGSTSDTLGSGLANGQVFRVHFRVPVSGWGGYPQAVRLDTVAKQPAGEIMPYAGATCPTGWLAADGSAVSRSTYAQLYANIGTNFGSGDGSTTFNLPDLRYSFLRGYGTNATASGSGTAASNNATFTAHPFTRTGMKVRLSSGTLSGLSTATDYWVIVVDANTLAFATTRANAIAGTKIAISGANSAVIAQYEDPDIASRTAQSPGGNTGANVGSYQADDYKSHTHNFDGSGNTYYMLRSTGTGTFGWTSGALPQTSNTTGVQASGGNESRPTNVAVLYCVRAYDNAGPAPVVIGSVLSGTSGMERIERAMISNNGSTASVVSQSGSWISSVSRAGTGNVVITIATGYFSAEPACTVTDRNGSTRVASIDATGGSATQVTVRTFATNDVAVDDPFAIHCMGPR